MFNLRTLFAAMLLGAFCLLSGGALADDWVAVKLRGNVFAYVDGAWEKLSRGDVVPDQRVVRTLPGGRVTFQRGSEVIDVGPSTQIQIVDRVGRRYTTVKQYYGTVQIDAEVQNVQHFAVQTPYLAAVVKGTRFTVTSNKRTSKVVVQRGRVQVNGLASGDRVVILAGQSAQTTSAGDLEVKGKPIQVVGANEAQSSGVALLSPKSGQSTGGTSAGTLSGGGTAVGGGSSPVGVGAHVSSGGIDASANLGGVSADVSVGSTGGGMGAGVEVGVPGTSGIGASVSTGGGGSLGGVSVETPLGGISLGLPLGL